MLVYDSWISMRIFFALHYYEVTSAEEIQNFAPSSYIIASSVIQLKNSASMSHLSQDPSGWYVKIQDTIQRFRCIEFNCYYAEAFVSHNQNPGSIIL